MHTVIPMPSDRASQDGVSDFASSPQTAVPSMTHARIPVRPQRRVGYASGNKKGVYDVSRQRNRAANPIGLHSTEAMNKVRIRCAGMQKKWAPEGAR
jgi:hypothetical protein